MHSIWFDHLRCLMNDKEHPYQVVGFKQDFHNLINILLPLAYCRSTVVVLRLGGCGQVIPVPVFLEGVPVGKGSLHLALLVPGAEEAAALVPEIAAPPLPLFLGGLGEAGGVVRVHPAVPLEVLPEPGTVAAPGPVALVPASVTFVFAGHCAVTKALIGDH